MLTCLECFISVHFALHWLILYQYYKSTSFPSLKYTLPLCCWHNPENRKSSVILPIIWQAFTNFLPFLFRFFPDGSLFTVFVHAQVLTLKVGSVSYVIKLKVNSSAYVNKPIKINHIKIFWESHFFETYKWIAKFIFISH